MNAVILPIGHKRCCLGAAKPAVVAAPAHRHDLPRAPDNDVAAVAAAA